MRIFIMKRLLLICILGLSLFALAGLQPDRVSAAPLLQTGCTLPATVTTAAELSSCITAANTNGAGLDTITLGADITLTSALPQIITRITLEGAGYFIDGGNSIRIFYVAPSGDFIVNRTTLKNGNTTGQGGGIFSGGTLMVTNSTFSGNRATADGGGIYSSGSAVVSNSTFSGNRATDGGGISNYAVLTVIDSTFSANSATGNGGGIFNAGQLEVTNSTVSGNSATGNGGGIFVSNAGLGLTNSTISGNSATAGGGIYANRSTLTVRNSTISSNSATGNGGGISNNETLQTMTNSTISGNSATSGGGIYYGGGEVHLAGVIFAGGSGSDNCASSDGTNFGNNYNLFDNRYNLSDDASCGFWRNSSINNATLNLGNLADNGGPTQTHLPNAGSDAIGAIPYGTTISNNGTSWTCNQSATDQRGELRPLNSGDACTAGAVEGLPPCPAWTATTADELYQCIRRANANESPSPTANTITLVANINLTSPLPQITTEITLEGAGYFIDGGNSIQIFNVGSAGDLTIKEATLQNGFATNGGAVYNDGTLTLLKSTLFGNNATTGGSIYNATSAAYLMANIFARGTNGANCFSGGAINDIGYNLSNDATCTNGGTGSATNASLPLGALADNGGPTQTHLPNADSDAIGAIPYGTQIGPIWSCDQSNTDQRGELRPINSGDACTAGAVEVTPLPPCLSWTVTTADELFACILQANGNESPSPTADTITLGADITLSAALPQITSEITLEGANHVIDGGWDGVPGSGTGLQIFYVNSGGDFTINQVTLQNGEATNGGGLQNSGTVTVTNSTFSSNSAYGGGGVHNSGPLNITNSTFSGNRADFGGGVYNNGGALTVTSSTVSDNSADYGGGIYNTGPLAATNSTFSGNSATTNGGGVYNDGGTAHLAGSIFVAGLNGANCAGSGTLTDNGYNLSDDATCTNGGTGSLNNAMLNLGDLADNGGPTQTHLPGAGSDAIGAIPYGTTISNNGVTLACNQTTTDQLGADRPINVGTACTAGAVEVALPPLCPAWTVTTAAELSDCITLANTNESPSPTADTITLGADITLITALPQIASEITLEGAGYTVDGDNSVRLFIVGSTGNLAINALTITKGSLSGIGSGSGIYNNGTLTVTNSTFSENRDGGITNNGTLTVTDSTFSENWEGGGIINNGMLTVANSTFSNNPAESGGGIYNDGTLTVTNSTFSGNGANYNGGGIYNAFGKTATLINSTFSGNGAGEGGGGVYNRGTMYLAGTIFADNTNGNNCVANSGTLTDNGYNLSDDTSCGFSGTGSANNATLNLDTLANNGGPTQTHLPSAGSDAIGAIPNGTTISNSGTSWTCDQTATDQRGESRPINSGDDCTAGAVEVEPPAQNVAPVANDDSATTNENTSVNIAVLANDSDVDGDMLTIESVTDPANGTVVNNGADVTYTPTTGFSGSDSFSYTVSDGNGGADTATVTITVNAVNVAPVAVDDSATTDEDTPVNIAVLTNDTDADGDNLTVVSITQPSNGSTAIEVDGTVTYTPTTGFSGSDSFTYTISDGNGGSATATVNVTVNAVNAAPVAVDDSAATDENTPVNIDVLVNDTDSDGDSLTVVSITQPSNGSVTIEVDGTVTYTPTTGFSGSDSFSYTVSDGNGGADTATVTITVNAVNVDPVAVDDSATTDEDTPVNIAVLANDSDADGDRLTVESVTQPTNGSTAIEVDGTVSYTPTTGFTGSDSFSYTVSDGNGGADTATVTITVNGVNNAPVAVDDSATTNEDTTVTIDVLANDTDTDGDSLTVESITQPTNGSTAIEVDGTVTYIPTTGFSGSDSFTYTISDGNGGTDTATVAVTVNSTNFLPLIVNDLAETNEDSSVTIDVLANDSDPDGDPLQIESVTASTNGTAAIVNNMVVYTPTPNFNGVDSFTYTANDGNGGADTATVDITVTAVNDAPVATDDSATTDENTAVTIDVLANDSDVDGNTLTIESVTDPANGSTVIEADGTVTYTPNPGFAGNDTFTYVANDGLEDSNVATVTITVNAVSTPIATCGGYDVFETAPGLYEAPGFLGNLIVGTDGYDWLIGTDGPDLILGLQGSDDLWGLAGDDVICGGAGVDIILGHQGNDLLYGGDQPDWLVGGADEDTLFGGAGNDDLFGNSGNDTLHGEAGNDVLAGGSHHDTLYGGEDDDELYGNLGDDALFGGPADDFCRGGVGKDTIAECEGASATDAIEDEALDTDEETIRRRNDGANGEHVIEERIQQLYLPLVTK